MAGFSQNDSQWANDALGTSDYWLMGNAQGNARAAGCYVTAGANVLRAFGHDINPGDLNRLATANGLINGNGDVTRHDWLAVLFPDVLQFVEAKNWGSELADLHYLDTRNDLNTEIIIEIDDSPAGGMQTHFMRTVGWDGGTDVIVDDSWDGIRKGVNAYGARWSPAVHAASIIYTAIKYVRVSAPAPDVPAPQPVSVPEPVPTPITPPVEETPVETPIPETVVTPDPTPEAPLPTPETHPVVAPTPKVVVVPPSYFSWVQLLVALFKKLLKKGL